MKLPEGPRHHDRVIRFQSEAEVAVSLTTRTSPRFTICKKL